tara:strand:+ start:1574 stop:3991 length:2418 start_codon:yes stop_codon:yes gene_type:complete
MAKLGSLVVNIGANTKDLNAKLGLVRKNMRSMSSNFTAIGASMTRGLTLPLLAIGAGSAKLAVDFQGAMASVKAVSGATGDEFKALEQSAKDLGASTVFTARDVAALQLEYSRLGFSASEIMQVQEATLNLAQATGTDLAQAAEVAGSTVRQYGLDVSETGKVTDVMAASFSASALTIDTFQDAMSYVGPVAKTAGVTLQETAAMLGVLANSGIKGSKAGTSLKRILEEMQGTSGTLTERFQQLGEKGISLTGAMDEVGRRSATSLIVLSDGAEQVKTLTNEFNNSKGAAKAMSDIMNDTAMGGLKEMTSALEGAGIALGEMLIPFIRDAAKFITDLATSFKDISPHIKHNMMVWLGLAAAIGPLLVMVPKIILSIKLLGATFATSLPHITFAIIALGALSLLFLDTERDAGKAAVGVRKVETAVINLNKAQLEIAAQVGVGAGADAIAESMEFAALRVAEAQELIQDIQTKADARGFMGDAARAAINDAKAYEREYQRVINAGLRLLDVNKSIEEQAELNKGGIVIIDPATVGSIDELKERVSFLTAKLYDVKIGSDLFKETQIELAAASKELDEALGGTAEAVTILDDAIKFPIGSLGQMREKLSDLQNELLLLNPLSQEFADKMASIDEMSLLVNGSMEGMKESVNETSNAFKGLGQNISNALVDAVFEAKSFGDSLVEIGKQILKTLLAEAIGNAIVNAASSKNLANNVSGGLTIPAFITAGVGAVTGAMPQLASGGLAFGETMSIVGDNKNAAIDPEVIAPLSKLKQYMGGGSTNVYGRISGDDIVISNTRASRDRNRFE